jgi:hypothetical protein
MTFLDVLVEVCNTPELVAQYDRIYGSNLSYHGSLLALQIDQACGRQESEFPAFVEWVKDVVWDRVPRSE